MSAVPALHGPDALPLRALLWVLACLVGAVALHIDRLPAWISLTALAFVVSRYALQLREVSFPGSWVRAILALGLLLAVVAQFHTFGGLAAGSALLICMSAVKLLETHTRRDALVIVASSLFLMLSACLDRQSLLRTPLYVAETWLTCAALGVLSAPHAHLSARTAFLIAGRGFLFGAPVSVALFLFFPRIQGQIWALPAGQTAVTGLSDEMSPGAISQLSEVDDPAFRVRFLGHTPAPQDLYWRGPVLHSFDGYTWRRDQLVNYRQEHLDFLGLPIVYRITLEPHQRNWLFSLDTAIGAPNSSVLLTFDSQLIAIQPVTQVISYELTSHVATRSLDPLSINARRYDTQLPGNRNPRSIALGQRLITQAGSTEALIKLVLDYFRRDGFEYTLTPPKLDLDSIDDFLFNTKRGFCGHFASAFVTLMRAAGVPARVVTGYQGGEWNPIGGYYIVRQSDAHAWAEVWIDGRGWQRVDPTAVVAPERLLRAASELAANDEQAGFRMFANLGFLSRLRLGWDAANTWWHDKVLDFNMRAQLSLLEKMGFRSPSPRHLGWLLAAGLTLWLGWLAWQLGRNFRPKRGDALAQAYRRLCKELSRYAPPRAAHEGPTDYARRLSLEATQGAERFLPLLMRYAALRFGSHSTGAARRRLVQQTRWWRLRALRAAPHGRSLGCAIGIIDEGGRSTSILGLQAVTIDQIVQRRARDAE